MSLLLEYQKQRECPSTVSNPTSVWDPCRLSYHDLESLLTTASTRVTALHDSVNRLLSPKLDFSDTFRAELRDNLYTSGIHRYWVLLMEQLHACNWIISARMADYIAQIETNSSDYIEASQKRQRTQLERTIEDLKVNAAPLLRDLEQLQLCTAEIDALLGEMRMAHALEEGSGKELHAFLREIHVVRDSRALIRSLICKIGNVAAKYEKVVEAARAAEIHAQSAWLGEEQRRVNILQ